MEPDGPPVDLHRACLVRQAHTPDRRAGLHGTIERIDTGAPLRQVEHDVALALTNRLATLAAPGACTVPFTYASLARDLGWSAPGGKMVQRLRQALTGLRNATFAGHFYSPTHQQLRKFAAFGLVDSVMEPETINGVRYVGAVRLSPDLVTSITHTDHPNLTWFNNHEYG